MLNKVREILKFFIKHKNIFKVICAISIALLGFIFIFIVKVSHISESKSYQVYFNEDDSGNSKEISEESIIKQDFNFNKNISGVNIYFATKQENNVGNINVKLLDINQNKLVEQWQVSASEIKNEEYHQFILKNATSNNLDSRYQIEITSDYKGNDNTPTVKLSSRDIYKNGNLFFNDENQNADICFSVSTNKSEFINYIYFTLAVILTIYIAILFYLTQIKKCKIEKLFLVSALFIGGSYLLLITPYSISDESKHINTAYRYSNIFTFSGGYQTEDGNMLKRISDTEVFGLRTSPSISTYNVVISHFFDRCNSDEMIETEGERVGNICQYIPSAIGITIARILNLGYIPLIYMARLCNFLFFITMAYLAIKNAPFGKLVFFAVAMLPMTLQQAASCSYDAIVNGIAFVFISYCLRVAFSDRKITARDIIILFILGSIFAAAKAGVYIFVCLLIFIIPKNRFKNHKRYIISIAGIIGAALATLLYFNNVKVTKAVTITSKELANYSSQVAYPFSYLFHNPFAFIKMVYNTIVNQSDFYLSTLIGGELGWYTIPIPLVIVISYIIILIFSGQRP